MNPSLWLLNLFIKLPDVVLLPLVLPKEDSPKREKKLIYVRAVLYTVSVRTPSLENF